MKSQKELNKLIASLLGEPETFDVRENLRVFKEKLSEVDANELLNNLTDQFDPKSISYTITSTPSPGYSSEVDLALYAAQRIAERNQCTFVLSLEDGVWKAAYGNWGDCSEFKGSNPAYVTCISILKYMGKL